MTLDNVRTAARSYRETLLKQENEAARIVAGLQTAANASSQKAVAKKLGLSQQYLNDILHGRRKVCEAFVTRILRRD